MSMVGEPEGNKVTYKQSLVCIIGRHCGCWLTQQLAPNSLVCRQGLEPWQNDGGGREGGSLAHDACPQSLSNTDYILVYETASRDSDDHIVEEVQ